MALEAINLSFGYDRRSLVIENLSIEVEAGALLALTGPSGRGKSTLLYVFGLLLRPTSGDVSIDGELTSGLPDSERSRLRARHLGFVFQDACLDPTRSVLDNIIEGSVYRGQSRRKAQESARQLMARFSVDLDPRRPPTRISGGQAQRVALCRALISAPSLILADEPTGNLDRANAELVVDALRQAADEGATVLIATHDPFIISSVDQTFELP